MEDSNAKNVLEGLNAMRNEKMLCNVKLKVNSTTFDAHRLVLASVSPYFCGMFCGHFKEGKTSSSKTQKKKQRSRDIQKESSDCIVLHEIDELGFQLVLDSVYTSDLKLTKDNVCEVLTVAHFFQLFHIGNLCETFMTANITPSHIFSISSLYRKICLAQFG